MLKFQILTKRVCKSTILKLNFSNQLSDANNSRQEDRRVKNRIFFLKEQDHPDPRQKFFNAIEDYKEHNVSGRGLVEFVYDALSKMKEHKVHKNTGAYKALISAFPPKIMVPENTFQIAFVHYPKQQLCLGHVLDQMFHYGCLPDEDLFYLIKDRFGTWTHVQRRVRREMYWAAKLKNISPHTSLRQSLLELMPPSKFNRSDNLEIVSLTMAQLALYRIFENVDLDFETSAFYRLDDVKNFVKKFEKKPFGRGKMPTIPPYIDLEPPSIFFPNSSKLLENVSLIEPPQSSKEQQFFLPLQSSVEPIYQIDCQDETDQNNKSHRPLPCHSYLIRRDTAKSLKRHFSQLKQIDREIENPFFDKETLFQYVTLQKDPLQSLYDIDGKSRLKWEFICSQSHDQRILLKELIKKSKADDKYLEKIILNVEGPHLMWIQEKPIKYYILKYNLNEKEKAERDTIEKLTEREYDDFNDWTLFYEKYGVPLSPYNMVSNHEIMPDCSRLLGYVIFRADMSDDFLQQDFENNFFKKDESLMLTSGVTTNVDTKQTSSQNENVISKNFNPSGLISHYSIHQWIQCMERFLGNIGLSHIPLTINYLPDQMKKETFDESAEFKNCKTRDYVRPLNHEELAHPVYRF